VIGLIKFKFGIQPFKKLCAQCFFSYEKYNLFLRVTQGEGFKNWVVDRAVSKNMVPPERPAFLAECIILLPIPLFTITWTVIISFVSGDTVNPSLF
jgi:hypothetical protein